MKAGMILAIGGVVLALSQISDSRMTAFAAGILIAFAGVIIIARHELADSIDDDA